MTEVEDTPSVINHYEYFILGRMPVRIGYNQENNPCVAEIPDYKTGGLVIDNTYIYTILVEAPDALYKVKKSEYDEVIDVINDAVTSQAR